MIESILATSSQVNNTITCRKEVDMPKIKIGTQKLNILYCEFSYILRIMATR